jgi:hypothetical protein
VNSFHNEGSGFESPAYDTSGKAGANLGAQIKGVIDNFTNNLQPTDILAGDAPTAVSALNEARRLAQIGFKSDALENGVENAADSTSITGSGGNINNKTRAPAKALKNSKQNWTPDEQAAIKAIIDGTPTQNALRLMGKASPEGNGLKALLEIGGIVTAMTHDSGFGASAIPAVAVPAAGYVAKRISDNVTKGKMNDLGDLIRSGGSVLTNTPNVVQQFASHVNLALSTALMGLGATASVRRPGSKRIAERGPEAGVQ